MAFDALATKSVAVGAAGTFFPVGPIVVGGASVDEFDMHKTPLQGSTMAVIVPAAVTGTSPVLTVTIESDDNTSFSSPQQRTAGPTITGTSGPNGNGSGRYEYTVPYIPERYIRVNLTASGTSPNFGTVTVGWVPIGNLARQA